VLGPKYGKKLAAIRRALESQDPAAVTQSVQRGESVVLSLDGGSVELLPDEILPSVREREGFAAMAEGGFLVALDTALTPELVREGWAREIVRRINDWRRSAGFNVDDRITIRYEASQELAAAIREHGRYIQQETLADELLQEPPTAAGFRAEARIGDEALSVELRQTAPVASMR
jgi:isoleucyl-tRNA synthetase